ncbi:DNA polymerase III subunit delta [Zeaxanthinibacter enoshimensis]|uniref:DNA polymerase III subunit delta n=1 Tax=Zeaxanthinibacter enoshimensis TaxID=392009 RepID=UPI003565522A
MEEVKQIVAAIRKGDIRPIYFLMGEEPYFIDKLAQFIGESILNEQEREFNQTVVYGKDTSIDEIVSVAKRFPMMAEKQVVIVKEAQHLVRTIEQLAGYAAQPQPTTVLVVCYKYKTIDKRKKLSKTLKDSQAVIFESKKLYENKVGDWIRQLMKSKGHAISLKASILLVEYLGADLSRIDKELEKLQGLLEEGEEITPQLIEKHIGISKDYNHFELKKALGERDIAKATRIVTYFAQNPKEHPFVMTVPFLHGYFSQLLQYHGLTDHSSRSVASALRISPYFVPEIQTAARNYPMKEVSRIVSHLRDMDLKGKGVGAANMSQADLLKELLVKIV